MGSNAESGEIITKGFLEQCLKSEGKYPDAEITSFKVALGTKPGDNYMSIIYTIDLELKGDENVPPKRKLLIKCYPNHPARQDFTNKSNMFFKEMMVYNRWMPELMRMQKEIVKLSEDQIIKLPYPPFVHGKCIDFESEQGKQEASRLMDSLENYIMMEDIKQYGFRMANRRLGLDIQHMHLAITALAKVHALSWAYKHHVEPDIKGNFSCFNMVMGDDDIQMWINIMGASFNQAAGVLNEILGEGNELSSATLKFKDNVMMPIMDVFMGKATSKLFEDYVRLKIDPKKYGREDDYEEEEWRIICHGDCWSNNMMFRYDTDGHPVEIILLDLQMPTETCVVNDLEYVIYASTSGDLRKEHLDHLLKLYYDEFNATCKKLKVETLPGFTLNELKYRFQRAKLFGFFFAMMGLPIMLKEEDKATNMDDMDKDKDFEDVFSEMGKGSDNEIYRNRLLELVRELYDDGIV